MNVSELGRKFLHCKNAYSNNWGKKRKEKEEEILLMAQKQAPPAPTPSAPKEDPIKAKSWKNQ